MQELMEKHPDMTPIEIIHHYKGFLHLYEVLYLFCWYLCPYWHTRAALKSKKLGILNEMWRYWMHLFITARKTRYSILSMRFLWLLRYMNPQLTKIFNDYRTFSFTGGKDTGIQIDGVNELVCIHATFFPLFS